MHNLSTTSELVKDIMTVNPGARDSDNYLFYLVCKKLLADQEIDIEDMLFTKLFLSLPAYGLPQFETVGRVRRKIQQEYPELQCSEEVRIGRSMKQDSFMDYATEGM